MSLKCIFYYLFCLIYKIDRLRIKENRLSNQWPTLENNVHWTNDPGSNLALITFSLIHECIPSCVAVSDLQTYKSERCQVVCCPGCSVGRELVCWTNDPDSNPVMDTFSLCWLYALLAKWIKFNIIYLAL